MCRYWSNVTHVWRPPAPRGDRRARVAPHECVCVWGGAGGGPHTGAGGQCPPTARRPDIRHSCDTAAPGARLVSSLRAREPSATHVRAVLAPVATLDNNAQSHRLQLCSATKLFGDLVLSDLTVVAKKSV